MLANLIEKMQHELINHNHGYVERFEDLLAQVSAVNDPECIPPLLSIFDDNAEHDVTMFSVIHAIEDFDDATYVEAIIEHFNTLFAKSPRWAIVIQMRILNSPSTMASFAERIKSLPSYKRQAVREVLEAVRRKNAKFEAQCHSLIALL